MSHSLPATPDHGGARIMSLLAPAVPSIEKIKSTARKQSLEPSPASTYGDSAEENTAPATPEDVTKDIASVRIDIDALAKAAKSMDVSIDQKTSDLEIASLAGSSPSSIKAKPGHNTSSAKSSPLKQLTVKIPGNGNWRAKSDGPAAPDGEPGADDPFVGETGPTYRPRPDRPNNPITNMTAQAYYGTEACIFVANLAQYVDDEQLTLSVAHVFAKFGTNFVKVRRDRRGMPFAFIQFEVARNARRAVHEGRGIMIHGRPCRTEAGKCNRALYLSRCAGGPVTEEEAREILQHCGRISEVWYASDTDREMYRLPEGAWIRFDMFDDCRDAKAVFRNNPEYRLEDPRLIDESQSGRTVGGYYSGPNWTGNPASPPVSATAWTRSIFIGNLPEHITKVDLEDLFRIHGPIQAVNIVRRQSNFAGGVPNVFAFLEYLTPNEVEVAVKAPSITIEGHQLRVERKEARTLTSEASAGSPMRMSIQAGQAYQRGLAAGMQAAQVQPTTPPMISPYYPGPYEPYYAPSPFAFDHHNYSHGAYAAPVAPPQFNTMPAPSMMTYAPYHQAHEMAANGFASASSAP